MNFDNIPVVAYGYENTRPTERAALMMVKLENASDQYPDLAVPLVRLSDVRAELSRQASQNRVCGYLVADGELCRKCGKRHAAAQSQPLVEPTADISGTPPGEWGGLSPKQAWWAGYRVGKGLPADMKRSDAVSADPGYDLWQPIETAPRSGLPFLAVCARYGSVFMAHWANGVVDSCVQADEGYEDRPAKFWMPLPASPQHQVKKGEPS